MKFEILTAQLSEFVNYCHIRGGIENKELLIKCSKDNLSARAISNPSNTKDVCVNARLYGEFSPMGEIGIDDLTTLRNFLNSLNSEKVTLKKFENKLVCETKKQKLSSVLRGPAFIVNSVEEEKFDNRFKNLIDNALVISKGDLQDILAQIKALQSEFITFNGEANILKVTLGKINNELEFTLDLTKAVQPFKVKLFANKFADVVTGLADNDLVFYMKERSPIGIELKKNEALYQYLISPLLKD